MAPTSDNVLRPLVVVVGPTACGKSALALELAAHCPIEIVSADSRTVYRWMDIGTAKPSLVERQAVPYHVLDVVDPDESYSLAHYQQDALAAIDRIYARARFPVLVGGAGLYVSAVCDGLQLPDVAPDEEFRAALEARAEREGWQALQVELRAVDPVSAERIEPRNVRRVIRALEVQHVTGKPFSAWQQRQEPPFRPVLVAIDVEREELYRRIDSRIDAWFASGFVDEVRTLLARGYDEKLPSMSGIGYREVSAMLRGELTEDQAKQQMKFATHQYARRQLTWFRRDARIQWGLDVESIRKLLDG